MQSMLLRRVYSCLVSIALINFFPFSSSAATAGDLAGYTLIKSFSAEELKAFFKENHIPKVVLPVNKGINVYEEVYYSTYSDGSLIKASGLLYVPIIEGKELPLMIYDHGTEMCRDRACDFKDEQTIDLAFATDEYIVMTPDYFGLGVGDKLQLYLNADAEAHASIDMLIGAQQLLAQLKVKYNQQLFVTGYSQGGHAAMATTRMLQQQYKGRFTVTASAPMSGPYDVEHTVYNARNSHFDYPGFLLLLVQSYFVSTGQPDGFRQILAPPYDTIMPPLLNGDYPVEEIDKLLPDTIFKIIKPGFYTEFENDSSSGFRKFLRSNDVFDWKPEMPMQLCYCNADEEVDFHNSIEASKTMKKNGSTTVELWRAGKKFGHVNCALFAVVYTKMFFDGFREGKPGSHGPVFKRLLLTLGKLAVKAR